MKVEEDNEHINTVEDDLFYEDNADQQPPTDIVAYNELRSCADLVRMYKKGILEIQPDFQRETVWKIAAQTRFVDSLTKQLPIPSMCFSLDYKTQKWQVIDGLQRMTSIIKFLTSNDWRLSALDDIDQNISGKKVTEFRNEDSQYHTYYQRVEDLTLPITVIRCDYSKKSHMEYLFTIFHRLNSGGTKLNNQEIRNCIFSGTFNSMLKELNGVQNWRLINRLGDRESERFKHEEIILRFFSFYDNKKNYNGVLSKFLNEYMRDNRTPDKAFIEQKKTIFTRAVNVLHEKILKPGEERVSISMLEALMFGVAKNIDSVESLSEQRCYELFDQLKKVDALSTSYLSGGVAKKEKVDARMDAAFNIFQTTE